MKKLLICSLGLLLFSCSKKATIYGIYENGKDEKVTIDCDYRITFDKLEGLFMPDNGDKITLTTNKMGATELEMDYMAGDTMMSAFGKWNTQTGEMNINGVSYTKKKEISCGK